MDRITFEERSMQIYEERERITDSIRFVEKMIDDKLSVNAAAHFKILKQYMNDKLNEDMCNRLSDLYSEMVGPEIKYDYAWQTYPTPVDYSKLEVQTIAAN